MDEKIDLRNISIATNGAPSFFEGQRIVSSSDIDQYLKKFESFMNLAEIKNAREEIENMFYLSMEGELSILGDDDENHEDWYNPDLGEAMDRKIKWHYWDYYKKYLQHKKLGVRAINELDHVTNLILSKLTDPDSSQNRWDRRGLVMGSVQSGKTGNYTGLIAKALDAGYKFIVVLTGMHNSLRSQTQLRVNDELLGYDIKRLDKSSLTKSKRVGVGALFPMHQGKQIQTLTTSSDDGDFRKSTAIAVNAVLSNPHVLIIKKNPTVMKNLIEWVQKYADTDDGLIKDVPMLMIDDECDQASINTKKENEFNDDGENLDDPTKTNMRIRELLTSFEKSAYVGYTATPFANIFIKSDKKHKSLGDDLFPRNFIFSLKRPSSYVGPEEFFGLKDPEKTKELPLTRAVSDSSVFFPQKHKSDLKVEGIPKSMIESIKCYILSLAARKIRKTKNIHSSMLIHVSRYTNVQNQTRELVVTELKRLNYRIQDDKDELDDFRELWINNFQATTSKVKKIASESGQDKRWGDLTEISWEEIFLLLPKIAPLIRVNVINGTSSDILEYKRMEDNSSGKEVPWEKKGYHVIAIGGDKLSRGLTLEGLTISYYLRSSTMYDTLMQMGRWFGYRDGYVDLCRIYSTQNIFTNFQQISTAEKDLREQFDEMALKNRTPKDFGLSVLGDPGMLLVTNRGKSRNATELNVTFGGKGPEINQFSPSEVQENWNVLKDLVESLENEAVPKSNPPHIHYTSVEREIIVRFIKDYVMHKDQTTVQQALHKFISKQGGDLINNWDVILTGLESPDEQKPINSSHSLTLVRRKAIEYDKDKLAIKRIGNPHHEMLDLPKQVQKEYKATRKGKSITGASIRPYREPNRGLLLIYGISNPQGEEHPYGGKDDKHNPTDYPYYGFQLSFPQSDQFISESVVVNSVYMEEW